MVTEKTTTSRTVLGFTKEKDKHNAPLPKISVYPDTPQAQEAQKPTRQAMTVMDLLEELVNRDKTPQEQPDGK